MDVGATEGGESGAGAVADERAASLRRMFPASLRTPPPSAGPSSPASSGPVLGPGPDGAEPPNRHAGRRWIAGAAAVLTLGAVAGLIAFRLAGDHPIPTIGPAAPATGEPEGLALSAGPRPGRSATNAGPPVSATAPAPTATTPDGPRVTTSATATNRASGPITAYSACMSDGTAQFVATFAAFSWRHAFIDTDDDGGTGYRVPEVSGGLGADYMIENGTLYRSNGSIWSWSEVKDVSPLVSAAGGAYRWRVPVSALDSPHGRLRVVFNGSGGSADAYTPVVETGTC